jgi:hypothetical protein
MTQLLTGYAIAAALALIAPAMPNSARRFGTGPKPC